MPYTKDEPFTGLAHCTSPRCPGHEQVEVEGIKGETFHTFVDEGGDLPGIAHSHVRLRFAHAGEEMKKGEFDSDDRPCPHCSRIREITDQPRKQYAPLSGHDPNGLLQVGRFNPAKQAELRSQPLADPERDALVSQNQEQVAALAAMAERLAVLEAKEPVEEPVA